MGSHVWGFSAGMVRGQRTGTAESHVLPVRSNGRQTLFLLSEEKTRIAEINPCASGLRTVRPARLERATYSFGGCHSIQLSYGRSFRGL